MEDEHHFAARLIAVVFQGRLNFSNRAAKKGFEGFSDFSGKGQAAFGEEGRHVGKGGFDAVRGFKHHDGEISLRPFGKQLLPLAGFWRQKAVEVEIGFDNACDAQCTHDRARADNGDDLEPCLAHAAGKFRTRIADGGRTCVGNLCNSEVV